jgi:hypothetical protein
MIIIIGLIILVVAAVAGIAAVLGNAGHGHALTSGFSMLGYHVTGSTGTLFLYGIVIGAVAMLGLALLLGGARRSSRRGIAARRSLRQSRREQAAVSQDRDDLISQRDEAVRARAAGTLADGTLADGTLADGTLADGTLADGTPVGTTLADGTPAGGTPAGATPAEGMSGPVPGRLAQAGNGPGSWLRGLGSRLRPAPRQAPLPQQAPLQQAAPAPPESLAPEVVSAPAEESAHDVPAGDPAAV